MTRQEKRLAKKRGRPAIGKGHTVGVRLQPDLLSPLDTWIAAQPEPHPTRPEAVRLALKGWLSERGLLKPPPLDRAAIMEKIEELEAKAAALKHDGTPSPYQCPQDDEEGVIKNEATKLRNKLAKAKKP